MAKHTQEIDDISSPLTIKEIVVRYKQGGEEIFKDINDLAMLEKVINTILLQKFLQGDKE